MRYAKAVVFSVMTLGLIGCGSTGELPGDAQDGSLESNIESVVPEILAPEGAAVAFEDYLYPYNTLVSGGTTAQNIHYYNQGADGVLYYDISTLKSFTRTSDGGGNTVINESDDSAVVQTDVIEESKITVFTPVSTGGFTNEVYPSQIAKNDEVTTVVNDGVTMVCVVKDIVFGSQNLESLIPQDIQTDLLSRVTGGTYTADQFTYVNTMHIYCGATNGTTIDSYLVSGWGEVLSIINHADNSARYEILDKKSVQYY